MRAFLALLCVLLVPQVRSFFTTTCPRKEPPPGVLVLSPGSKLVLTCSGDVIVNGVNVKVTRSSSNSNRIGRSSVAPTTTGTSITKQTLGSTANEPYLSTTGDSITKQTLGSTANEPYLSTTGDSITKQTLGSTANEPYLSTTGDSITKQTLGSTANKPYLSTTRTSITKQTLGSTANEPYLSTTGDSITKQTLGSTANEPYLSTTGDSITKQTLGSTANEPYLSTTGTSITKQTLGSTANEPYLSTTRTSITKQTLGSTANKPYLSTKGNSTVTGKNSSTLYTDTGSTASPTTHLGNPTSVSRLLRSESHWEDKERKSEGDPEDMEEEDGEEGNRVTRGINSIPKWNWNGKMLQKAKRDWGEMAFENNGQTLSLSSVRQADSGSYSCHHRGRERFSLKVTVADPPETPSVSCYKKSPSSKVRCEWTPKKPSTKPYTCNLVVTKGHSSTSHALRCSYSHSLSRYWCALDYDEDELRTDHYVYLCVTSIAGNAASSLTSFVPLEILKPDPPSGVKVRKTAGRETYMKVTWNFPVSWKPEDFFFKLKYEIKYKPLTSSDAYEQIRKSSTRTTEITDVMPGVNYQIQVRAKDDLEGHWSDWSTPVIARREPPVVYSATLELPTEDGSAFMPEHTREELTEEEMSYHILWIPLSFLLLSFILAAYIFSHKDKFMPKIHHLSTITQRSDLSQPTPANRPASEVQALMTFTPPRYKERPVSQTEEAEEENEEDRIEAVHFNNTSYFLLRPE